MKMTAQWMEITAKKRATRRILADLPLRVKIEKLNAMRERLDQLRRFKPKAKAVESVGNCL